MIQNFYQTELMKIAASCAHFHAPRCAGRACIGRLTEDVTVKLSFVSTHIRNEFDALLICLINRRDGEIDRQLIGLQELWGDVMMHGDPVKPYIWEAFDTAEWYGFTPTSEQYTALSSEVNEYLSAFAEPEQTESLDMSM